MQSLSIKEGDFYLHGILCLCDSRWHARNTTEKRKAVHVKYFYVKLLGSFKTEFMILRWNLQSFWRYLCRLFGEGWPINVWYLFGLDRWFIRRYRKDWELDEHYKGDRHYHRKDGSVVRPKDYSFLWDEICKFCSFFWKKKSESHPLYGRSHFIDYRSKR